MDLTKSFDNCGTDYDNDDDDGDDEVDEIVVPLYDEVRDHIVEIASARNGSYARGDTKNEVWGDDDSADKHEIGVAGELVIAGLYSGLGAEIDTSVSASGDGGVDCQMELGGQMYMVDIKSSTYNGRGASLMVAQDHVEARDIVPDAYIS